MKLKKTFLTLMTTVLMTSSVYAANPSLDILVKGTDYFDGYGISYGAHSNNYEDGGDPAIILFVNGNAVSGRVIIEDGTTLVPLRVISEEMNVNVRWDDSSKTVYMIYGDTEVQVTIGSSYITVNGETVPISASAKIIDSATYVPLRAIASAFGSNVGYNGDCFYIEDLADIRVVWVQETSQKETLSVDEAVDIAKDVFINKFLPTEQELLSLQFGVDVNDITYENFNEVFQAKASYIQKLTCTYKADLGEYYYIQYFDNSIYALNQGILIDKYDGTFFPVTSYNLGALDIGAENEYTNVWRAVFL